MSLEAEVFSPVILEGDLRSEGLVKLSNGALLVSKGHDIYYVSATWEVRRWRGSFDENNDFSEDLTLPFICGLCLVNEQDLYLGCEIDYTIMLLVGGKTVRFAGTGSLGKTDGPRLEASFGFPGQIAHLHDNLYVTDYYRVIRKIDLKTGMVTSIGSGKENIGAALEDGLSSFASFGRPSCVLATRSGLLLIGDTHAIRSYDPNTGIITTLAGNGEKGFHDNENGKDARFAYPSGICELPNGLILITDSVNNRIRTMDPFAPHKVQTLLGNGTKARADGPLATASLSNPSTIILQDNGNLVWVEKHGLRVIENFTGASEFTNDLTFLLNQDQWLPEQTPTLKALSDFQWTPPGSERQYFLHSSILATTLPPEQLRDAFLRIDRLQLPEKAYHTFISMLYGHLPTEFEDINFKPSKERNQVSEEVNTTEYPPFPFSPKLNEMLTSLMRQIVLASEFPSLLLSQWLQSKFHACLAFVNTIGEIDSLLERKETEMSDILKYCILRRHRKAKLREKSSLVTSTLEAIAHLPKMKAHRKKVKTPSMILQLALQTMASSLSLSDTTSILDEHVKSTGEAAFGTPFEIVIQSDPVGSHPSKAIKVSDCLLFLRWPYFSRMLQAGMAESMNRRAELPSDFPPSILVPLVQFIYGASVNDKSWDLSPTSADYMLENAAEFGLVDSNGAPSLGFRSFLYQCQIAKAK